ncbi:MAG: hypothetical protein AAF597_20875, partial [Bacteroidota bacterium]
EMRFHTPDVGHLWAASSKIFLACLGLIALQYLLGLVFKNVLIQLGIGFFGIIAGFILSTTGLALTRWLPYTYPLIVTDSKATHAAHQQATFLGAHVGITGSLLWFVLCISLAIWWEQRRR